MVRVRLPEEGFAGKIGGGRAIKQKGHELRSYSPLGVTRQGLHRGEWQEMKLIGTIPRSALGSNPVKFTIMWLGEMGIHGKAETVGL